MVEILNYKSLQKGALQASFDVSIPEWRLKINSCKLFSSNGKKWITMPDRPYKDETGADKYFPLVVFEKDAKIKFEQACLKAIEALIPKPPADQAASQLDLFGDIPF